MEVIGIKTDLIREGDDLVEILQKSLRQAGLSLQEGDVLVVSESAVATWEGRVVDLREIVPSRLAASLAKRYEKDPQEMELILHESDQILGGIPGVVLTLKDGFLYPNAGIDHSNAPPGKVVLFPKDPQRSASVIRKGMAQGKRIGVIIGDSRTHPLRLGCVGVALACQGLAPVEDARGQKDLYGRELLITRKAVADNLVSAAQIVMGEGDEGVPAVIIRGAPVEILGEDYPQTFEMPKIAPQECMYIGSLRPGPRPYTGKYDHLILSAKEAMQGAYAPYSNFKVGAAALGKSGKIYSAGNVENASAGASICAERVALSLGTSSGEKEFLAVAVVGDSDRPVSPCGICRQTLIEFGKEILVIMANVKGEAHVATAEELLPAPFTAPFVNPKTAPGRETS